MAPNDVRSKMQYLARDPKYKVEKPYVVAFKVPESAGAQPSNHILDPQPRLIKDMRTREPFDINTCGFTMLHQRTALSAEDLRSNKAIAGVYFDELTELVRSHFPEYTEIVFLDSQYRKRDPRFPHAEGEEVSFAQPLTLAHVDFTPENARLRVAAVLGGEHPELQDRRFEVLNVWRVIRGPNNDWPLALCDFRTVNPRLDFIANDVVYEQGIGENTLLFFNEDHQWYYLSDQCPDEIIVFRNAASDDSAKPRAWHASFDNPLSQGEITNTRESLEVRLVGFLPDFQE